MAATRQWVHEGVFEARPTGVAHVRWFVAHHLRSPRSPLTASLAGLDTLILATVLAGPDPLPLGLHAPSADADGGSLTLVEELSTDWSVSVYDITTGGKWVWAAFDRAASKSKISHT